MAKSVVETEAERRKIVASMPRALASLRSRTISRYVVESRAIIRNRYELGCLVVEIEADPAEYGKGAVALLAGSLDLPLSFFYDAALVTKVFTLAEVEDLAGRRLPNSDCLQYEHLLAVARVADGAERAALLDRLLTNPLSVRELVATIRAKGLRLRSAGRGRGRKPRRPRSPLAAAEDLINSTQRFSQLVELVAQPLCDEIDVMPVSQFDTVLQARVTNVRDELIQLRQAAIDLHSRLSTNLQRVTDALAARTQGEVAVPVVNGTSAPEAAN